MHPLIGSSITVIERRKAEKKTPTSNPETGCDVVSTANGDLGGENQSNNSHSAEALVPTGCQNKLRGFLLKLRSYFKCFCLITITERLFNMEGTAHSGHLLALHGIKTLSMLWIIWAHTYGFAFPSVSSIPRMLRLVDNWISQFILNAFYAVDIFFVISGMLCCFGYFTYAARNGGRRISWMWFYLHRLIRITPLYMLVVSFYSFVFPFMGSGPIWDGERLSSVCKQYWWTNLLYINNFYPTHCQCLSWAWYLANDMQFYFISPLFLFILSSNRKIGYCVLGLAISASCAATFVITYQNNLISGVSNLPVQAATTDVFIGRYIQYFDMVYVRPYSRIGPFLLGMILGHHLFERSQNNNEPTRLSTRSLIVGWLFVVAVFYYCLFGLYRHDPNLMVASFHNAFSRVLFALAMVWIIFVCTTGQGGFFNTFLSWRGFIIPSRLSFSVFLIHPVLYTFFLGSLRSPIDLSYPILITYCLALYVAAHVISIFLNPLFEAPFVNIERLIRGRQ